MQLLPVLQVGVGVVYPHFGQGETHALAAPPRPSLLLLKPPPSCLVWPKPFNTLALLELQKICG